MLISADGLPRSAKHRLHSAGSRTHIWQRRQTKQDAFLKSRAAPRALGPFRTRGITNVSAGSWFN